MRTLVASLGAGFVVTALLFLLIPLMNRTAYGRPELKRGARARWIRTKKERVRSTAEAKPPRAKPRAQRPPKPPPPEPRFARPAPPRARARSAAGPLRVDAFALEGLGIGNIPLHVPEDPPETEAEAAAAPEKPGPAREKELYLPHEIDTPPRPLRRVTPTYPRRAFRRSVEGFAVLTFVVDRDGRIRDVAVAEWEGSREFGDAAEKALRRWTFAPGRRKGEPVAVRCRLRFHFREED
jgi:protein TonB